MKLKYLSILFAFGFSTSLLAQNPARCLTPDKVKEYAAAHPLLSAKAEQNEQKIQQWITTHKNAKAQSVLVIPVVFHVIYENAIQNIPDTKLQLQLDILNKDYRKLNADTSGIPAAFKPFLADCEIEFCLAKRDEWGAVTTGIMRKQTLVNEIGSTNYYYRTNFGGDGIWNRDSYLNIWVCEIAQNGGVLGYSTVPSFSPSDSTDGVVIDYRYVGTSSITAYNKGRTATHEIGHWLDLQHIWGDDFGTCAIDDFVSDTPPQGAEHYGLPTFPSLDSCSPNAPGTMFMNYMDYTDDSGMHMFTNGQKQRIWASLMTTLRDSLFSSKGCLPVGIDEQKSDNKISIAPNPTTSWFTIKLNFVSEPGNLLQIFDKQGRVIKQFSVSPSVRFSQEVDFSEYPSGLYFIKYSSPTQSFTKKLIKN
jgi:Pregnancy-associated plasma protein-A/Secretion system C-terminal sorting domain